MNGGSFQLSVSVKVSGSIPAPGNTPTNTIPDAQKTVGGGSTQTVSYGTGSGKGDSFCSAEFAIAPGATLTLDLYAGGVDDEDLPDLFRHAAPLRVVRSVVVAIGTGTGDASGVRVGGAAADEWQGWFVQAGGQQDIFPGGAPFVQGSPAGKEVTATARNLAIENLSASEYVRVRVSLAGGKITSGMSMGTLGGVYP